MGQVFENGAFRIPVSIRSKLSFSERFMSVEVFRKIEKNPSVIRFLLAHVKCMPQKMGTGMVKGEMAKTEIDIVFFPWPCSLKELVLAEIPIFSLNQTNIQHVLSVVRN